MNAEQLKGKWTHFKGDLKQKWGKFTDDDLKQIEGNYEKFIGKVQERYAGENVELMKWATHGMTRRRRNPRGRKKATLSGWHSRETPDVPRLHVT